MYAACRKTAYRVVLQKDMEQMKAYTQRGGFAGGCHLLGRGIGYGVEMMSGCDCCQNKDGNGQS